ncbi:MAG: DUF3786 domain-containing protein [Candidatus Omnitrophica bacterium]|nr:DUF3786 domain-containing protein [Candidatus Omnitrophota bacterium]
MGYDIALSKAWSEFENLAKDKALSVRFLADEYNIDLANKQILSLSCNVPTKEYLSIIILHYLTKKIEGLPVVSGEWIDFRQLDGGQGYYPNFRKRVIESIKRKYGSNPDTLLNLSERFNVKRVQLADVSIVVEVFDNVPILIELWKGDEEFGPEANVLFDKSIKDILCTEDIVVLAGFVASNI